MTLWTPSEPSGPPARMQLRRVAGFWLHGYSVALNGRQAVSVARPGRFGNPFKVGKGVDAALAQAAHRALICGESALPVVVSGAALPTLLAYRDRVLADLPGLKGKNIACWCDLPTPGEPDFCHGFTLLELANPEIADDDA